jgi:hypothetical protein
MTTTNRVQQRVDKRYSRPFSRRKNQKEMEYNALGY